MRIKSPRSVLSATHRAAARAFTLLEILVVLAIIGLLAGVLMKNFDSYFDGAKLSTAKLFVTASVSTPLTAYKIQMGDFPSTAEGLQALITAPSNHADRWHGPYLDKLPLDPWNEPYQYAYPGTHNKGSYDIWSKGRDHESGSADDIGNWESGPTENK